MLTGLAARHALWLPAPTSLLLGTGFCGAYTTFSSFGYDTVQLFTQGHARRALANGIGQPVLCSLAAWIGLVLGTHPS